MGLALPEIDLPEGGTEGNALLVWQVPRRAVGDDHSGWAELEAPLVDEDVVNERWHAINRNKYVEVFWVNVQATKEEHEGGRPSYYRVQLVELHKE